MTENGTILQKHPIPRQRALVDGDAGSRLTFEIEIPALAARQMSILWAPAIFGGMPEGYATSEFQ